MSMMMDGLVVEDKRPMDANDRCDGCGAQAYVRVTLLSGDLQFCNHHYNKSEEALRADAIAVHDEREKLLVKP